MTIRDDSSTRTTVGDTRSLLRPAFLDYAVHISSEHRYIYVVNPKVGCSSILWSLRRFELGDTDLLPPEGSPVDTVSRELGVSLATLEHWRTDRCLVAAGRQEDLDSSGLLGSSDCHDGDRRGSEERLVWREGPVPKLVGGVAANCHRGRGGAEKGQQ